MADNYILTTSGFILPNNTYYSILDTSKLSSDSIFIKTTVIPTDNNLVSYTRNNFIYHSPLANEAYKKYEATKSFDSFMTLVNIATEILSVIPYDSFFEIQANNRNMSPYSFLFCLDIYTYEFINKRHAYDAMPLSARFTPYGTVSEETIKKNVKYVRQVKEYYRLTWETALAELAEDRHAFSTFFKYVFVDAY